MPNHPRTLIALVAGMMCAPTHAQQLPLCSQIPTLSTQECIVGDGKATYDSQAAPEMYEHNGRHAPSKPPYTVQQKAMGKISASPILVLPECRGDACRLYDQKYEPSSKIFDKWQTPSVPLYAADVYVRYSVHRETVDETGLPALIFFKNGKFVALKMYRSEKEARADETLWKDRGVIVK